MFERQNRRANQRQVDFHDASTTAQLAVTSSLFNDGDVFDITEKNRNLFRPSWLATESTENIRDLVERAETNKEARAESLESVLSVIMSSPDNNLPSVHRSTEVIHGDEVQLFKVDGSCVIWIELAPLPGHSHTREVAAFPDKPSVDQFVYHGRAVQSPLGVAAMAIVIMDSHGKSGWQHNARSALQQHGAKPRWMIRTSGSVWSLLHRSPYNRGAVGEHTVWSGDYTVDVSRLSGASVLWFTCFMEFDALTTGARLDELLERRLSYAAGHRRDLSTRLSEIYPNACNMIARSNLFRESRAAGARRIDEKRVKSTAAELLLRIIACLRADAIQRIDEEALFRENVITMTSIAARALRGGFDETSDPEFARCVFDAIALRGRGSLPHVTPVGYLADPMSGYTLEQLKESWDSFIQPRRPVQGDDPPIRAPPDANLKYVVKNLSAARDEPHRLIDFSSFGVGDMADVFHHLLDISLSVQEGQRWFSWTLTDIERGRLGAHYTDARLVSIMVREQFRLLGTKERLIEAGGESASMLKTRLQEYTVLDPTMGSGRFLLEALMCLEDAVLGAVDRMEFADALSRNALVKDLYKIIACKCLYGADVHPVAVAVTRFAIHMYVSDVFPGLSLSGVEWNVLLADSFSGCFCPRDIVTDQLDSEVRNQVRQLFDRNPGVDFSDVLQDVCQTTVDMHNPTATWRRQSLFNKLFKAAELRCGRTCDGQLAAGPNGWSGEFVSGLHWFLAWPHMFNFEGGTFALVAGNPPWGQKTSATPLVRSVVDLYRRVVDHGARNQFVFALYRGVLATRPGGRFSFVLPLNFVTASANGRTRMFVFDELGHVHIRTVGANVPVARVVFPNASVQFCTVDGVRRTGGQGTAVVSSPTELTSWLTTSSSVQEITNGMLSIVAQAPAWNDALLGRTGTPSVSLVQKRGAGQAPSAALVSLPAMDLPRKDATLLVRSNDRPAKRMQGCHRMDPYLVSPPIPGDRVMADLFVPEGPAADKFRAAVNTSGGYVVWRVTFGNTGIPVRAIRASVISDDLVRFDSNLRGAAVNTASSDVPQDPHFYAALLNSTMIWSHFRLVNGSASMGLSALGEFRLPKVDAALGTPIDDRADNEVVPAVWNRLVDEVGDQWSMLVPIAPLFRSSCDLDTTTFEFPPQSPALAKLIAYGARRCHALQHVRRERANGQHIQRIAFSVDRVPAEIDDFPLWREYRRAEVVTNHLVALWYSLTPEMYAACGETSDDLGRLPVRDVPPHGPGTILSLVWDWLECAGNIVGPGVDDLLPLCRTFVGDAGVVGSPSESVTGAIYSSLPECVTERLGSAFELRERSLDWLRHHQIAVTSSPDGSVTFPRWMLGEEESLSLLLAAVSVLNIRCNLLVPRRANGGSVWVVSILPMILRDVSTPPTCIAVCMLGEDFAPVIFKSEPNVLRSSSSSLTSDTSTSKGKRKRI